MTSRSLDTWLDTPHNRDSLHEVQRFVRTTQLERGSRPTRLLVEAKTPTGLSAMSVAVESGQEMSVADFLSLTNTDAFIVLRGDQILHEQYFGGNRPKTRHIVMSVSKSFCGMLAGILVEDGTLDLDATVTKYIPGLAGGSFGTATVRQLLDMTAAPDFDMSYLNPDAEVQAGDRAAGWRPGQPGDADGTRAFLQSLQRSGIHGAAFQYCSATTDVLAWVLERAADVPYAELLETRIWQHVGAEADAQITVDASGTPYACAGMSMRLRDLARFGRLLLGHGRLDGTRVIPRSWIDTTASGGSFDTSDTSNRRAGTYKNQWWVPDGKSGAMFAAGIFGQYLWIDPTTDIVIAKFSSESDPLGHSAEHSHALRSIAGSPALSELAPAQHQGGTI